MSQVTFGFMADTRGGSEEIKLSTNSGGLRDSSVSRDVMLGRWINGALITGRQPEATLTQPRSDVLRLHKTTKCIVICCCLTFAGSDAAVSAGSHTRPDSLLRNNNIRTSLGPR